MKARLQGPLNNLSSEQRNQLHAWFCDNLTYREIVKRMWGKFGLRTSQAALSGYYKRNDFEIFGKKRAVVWNAQSVENALTRASESETIKLRVVIHVEIRPEIVTQERRP